MKRVRSGKGFLTSGFERLWSTMLRMRRGLVGSMEGLVQRLEEWSRREWRIFSLLKTLSVSVKERESFRILIGEDAGSYAQEAGAHAETRLLGVGVGRG